MSLRFDQADTPSKMLTTDADGNVVSTTDIPSAGFTPNYAILVHLGAWTAYATPALALAAAVSGDTINVWGAHTITAQLLDNGVHWWFAPGSTVTSTTCMIFNDAASGANEAVTCTIGGFGSFSTSGSYQVVNISNAGSDIVLCANSISSAYYTFYHTNGTLRIDIGTLSSSAGSVYVFYNAGGTLTGEVDIISASGASSELMDFLAGSMDLEIGTATNTGSGGKGLVVANSDASVRVTVDIRRLFITHSSGGRGISTSGYVTANIGDIIVDGTNAAVYFDSYGSHVRAERIIATNDYAQAVYCNGGTNYLNAQHIEHTSTATAGDGSHAVICAGGVLYLESNRVVASCSTTFAYKHSGGTCHMTVGRFENVHASGEAVDLSGAGAIFYGSPALVSGGSATDSINAGSARNVTVYGTLFMNKAKNANVTLLTGDYVESDASVT